MNFLCFHIVQSKCWRKVFKPKLALLLPGRSSFIRIDYWMTRRRLLNIPSRTRTWCWWKSLKNRLWRKGRRRQRWNRRMWDYKDLLRSGKRKVKNLWKDRKNWNWIQSTIRLSKDSGRDSIWKSRNIPAVKLKAELSKIVQGKIKDSKICKATSKKWRNLKWKRKNKYSGGKCQGSDKKKIFKKGKFKLVLKGRLKI